MSGIFGIINMDCQPVDRADLLRMSQVMAHRGPDGQGILHEGAAGIGHLMLCATPESLHEKLPWQDPESKLIITADARIDNRRELFAALGLNFQSAKGISDSQLILATFKKWDEACVDHLLGDFAFAIWDAGNQRLFCARDHMGLKPFYYYRSSHVFVFASAATAVVAAARVPRRINEGRIVDHLVVELEGVNNTSTFFENVYRMPPAHFAVINRQKFSMRRYWEPDPNVELRLGSDGEYADALEEVLVKAIKARLRCHKPVSSMLSGGVDSSTVSGIARSLYQQDGLGLLRTYSGISDEESDCQESRYIHMMIDHGGLDPFFIQPAEVNLNLENLDRIAAISEDPFGDSWTLLTLIYLAAREQGNIVVMDGIDGDGVAGLTTTYPTYLMRAGEIMRGLQEIREQKSSFFDDPSNRRMAYFTSIRSALTPDLIRRLRRHYQITSWEKAFIKKAMLTREFAEKVNLAGRYREYTSHSTQGFCPTLRHAHAERMVVPYLTVAIERYTSRAACCGVEARQPFNDKRVVEFFLSMPWEQKNQHGWSKYCLRHVLERVAPKQVAWRTTLDQIYWKFSDVWMNSNREEHLNFLSQHRVMLEHIIDMARVDELSHQAKRLDFDEKFSISNIAILLRWLEINS